MAVGRPEPCWPLCASRPASSRPGEASLGDVNGDGRADIRDVLGLLGGARAGIARAGQQDEQVVVAVPVTVAPSPPQRTLSEPLPSALHCSRAFGGRRQPESGALQGVGLRATPDPARPDSTCSGKEARSWGEIERSPEG